jgi:tight adherence protein C
MFALIRSCSGAAALALTLLLPWPGPILAPICFVIGARVPVLVARRSAKRRSSMIDAQIPQMLDLLAVASSAGLSAPLALRRAAEVVTGPLAEELEGVFAGVDMGARWRDELSAAADRLDLSDFRRAVATIARTETLGASLATSTSDLADSVRARRRSTLTERARTAPVRMLFPLVFLILPAFLLLTVVPVLLATVESFR